MKTSKVLITIGLVLSIIAFLIIISSGFNPIMSIVLLSIELWFYFKEKNVGRYAVAFIITGSVYIILNILSGSISINGLFYLVGGIMARNGK